LNKCSASRRMHAPPIWTAKLQWTLSSIHRPRNSLRRRVRISPRLMNCLSRSGSLQRTSLYG